MLSKQNHTIPAIVSSITLGLTFVSLNACTTTSTHCSQNTCESEQVALPDFTELENVFELTDGIYSGNAPSDRADFIELANLGIRTVISVDAIPPSAQLAGEHNIRIIHLPIGYDGISEQRTKELAFAMYSSLKPVYVHCHLGKHRGPAAACVGALALDLITHEEAHAFMAEAGTSPNYPGLWSSMSSTTKLNTIDTMPLTSSQEVPSINSAMSIISKNMETLWDRYHVGFATPDDQPDLTPASIAGQIHNLFRSLEESEEAKEYSDEFIQDMKYSADIASQLETTFRNGQLELAPDIMDKLDNSCIHCHDKL